MKPVFEKDIQEILPQVLAWRQHFHQYPEISFREFETTEYLVREIGKMPHVKITRPAPTGLVARLDTGKPGPVIALRADIDALSMPELTGLEYASCREGVMHACGHDAHTAMLLGVLSIFSKNREHLKGSFVFLFQHAEEQPPGGAVELVNAKVLDGVDAILGQHVAPIVAAGRVGLLAGASSANADCFEIVVRGQGGHASSPHLCIDPIPVAIQIVTAMQQIVSRGISPTEMAVVSVTRIHAGTADNIIPDTVTIGGTVRTYTKENREKIHEQIQSLTAKISEAEACTAEVRYTWGYPSTVNTADCVAELASLADAVYGPGTAVAIDPSMGGEDFSYYLEKVPGCMFYLGIKNTEKGCVFPGHNTKFLVDEETFGMGLVMMSNGALRFQQLIENQRV
ncbi:MAG TPA: amidohydrolase [Patescibacteria group bacterium]|nr:amidohydrolase [Patescibacteria group bacterium]